MDDEELIEGVRRGDEEAAAALVERYWQQVFRYLYRVSCHFHNAEELTQQTFLRILERLDQYATGSNFRAWMYRVATNLFLDHRRKLKPHAETTDGEPRSAPPSETPEAAAQGRELAEAVERAMAELPEELRIVLTLRVNEGMSHSQISGIVGAEEGTVRWRLHEARRRLSKALKGFL